MTRGITILSALLATLAVALPASAADGRTVTGVLVSVSRTAVAFRDAKSVVTICSRAAKSPSLDGYATGDRVQAACVRVRSRLVLVKIRLLPAASGTGSNNSEPSKFGGVVTALSDSSISLHDGDRDLTCSIGASSPSTSNVKVGQHVKVACSNGALVAIAPVASGEPGHTPGEPGHAYEGTVSAVGTSSITVHTDKVDGTCSVGDGSPSLAEVKVGDRVLIGCAAGSNQLVLLKKLAAGGSPPTGGGSPPSGQTGAGTISALSGSSVTFHNDEHGDATCTVGQSSPSLGDYKVGDKVKFGCLGGALVAIAKTGVAEGPHKTLGAAGTVSAVSSTSLTVHTDGGEVTCSVGDGSPTLATVHVGDNVKIGCLDGVLKVVFTTAATTPPAAPPTGDHHTVITVGGSLSVLSSSSVTVHSSERGDVSCTVGTSSPHLGDFHVGDHVGMACVDGVVAKLVKL